METSAVEPLLMISSAVSTHHQDLRGQIYWLMNEVSEAIPLSVGLDIAQPAQSAGENCIEAGTIFIARCDETRKTSDRRGGSFSIGEKTNCFTDAEQS